MSRQIDDSTPSACEGDLQRQLRYPQGSELLTYLGTYLGTQVGRYVVNE